MHVTSIATKLFFHVFYVHTVLMYHKVHLDMQWTSKNSWHWQPWTTCGCLFVCLFYIEMWSKNVLLGICYACFLFPFCTTFFFSIPVIHKKNKAFKYSSNEKKADDKIKFSIQCCKYIMLTTKVTAQTRQSILRESGWTWRLLYSFCFSVYNYTKLWLHYNVWCNICR